MSGMQVELKAGVQGSREITAGGVPAARRLFIRYLLTGLPVLCAWVLLYLLLRPFADWVVFHLLGLPRVPAAPGASGDLCSCGVPYAAIAGPARLSAAVWFYCYEAPKVLLLLLLMVFVVGFVRSFFTAERTRSLLAGSQAAGNVLAALLGTVTPFCSCSAVPLFIGFVTAGVPLGVTFSFLISAPMVNEVALVLLFGLFGWKAAALYLGTGLLIAILAGWSIGRLHPERQVEDWVYGSAMAGGESDVPALDLPGRIRYAWDAVGEIVGKVWPFILAGIAVGAGVHGYVPQGMLTSLLGARAWCPCRSPCSSASRFTPMPPASFRSCRRCWKRARRWARYWHS